MKIVNTGTENFTVRDITVQRLMINAFIFTSALAAVDFNKIRITCLLKRGGKNIQIFNGYLGVLVRESLFFSGYEYANNASQSIATAGNEYLIPLAIDLGSVINVKNDDELTVEMDLQAGWYGTGTTPANCYIDANWRQAIGVERVIPKINLETVKAGGGELKASLGDNVTRISVINTESAVISLAQARCTSLQIISDRYNISETFTQSLGRRSLQFDNVIVANLRYQSFTWLPETEIDNVQFIAVYNSANVAASANYLVWRSYEYDMTVANRASLYDEKHYQYDTAKARKALG